MGIAYRPEIDGLRAVAVLAVVLYHAGIGGAGFVGVDVFFVISGYLITSLLLCEWQATRCIDMLAFYARRARRIFPAAVLVVLAVLIVSPILLPPAQQVHTYLSAGAALLFGANLFFEFTSGGYFDGRAGEMPLLHLWSLSVEEQFYFLWPALLILVLRYRPGWLRQVIVGLGLLSFLLAEGLMAMDPEAAFYQMPARFWELAAGGLIATLPVRTLPRWAGPVGLLATVAACAWPIGHFPGLGAVPAVIGTALLLGAVHGGSTNVFLRSRAMVGIGMISYGLYLWHWPLLAFYRATSIGEGNIQTRLILCAIAVLLAMSSYRYIEQPIRRMRTSKGMAVGTGAAASLLLALVAFVLGLQRQEMTGTGDYNPMAAQAESDFPSKTCRYLVTDKVFPKCPDPIGARTAIWGDSMAFAWRPLAESLGPAIDYSRDACDPLLGYLPEKPFPGDVKCRDFNVQVAKRAALLNTVILAAAWPDDASLDSLARTLEALRSVRRVVILGPTPRMREMVPRCIRQDTLDECAITRAAFDEESAPVLARLRAIATRYPNVEVIDLTGHFCSTTTCPPVKGGVPLYWDTHHITSTAARSFVLPD